MSLCGFLVEGQGWGVTASASRGVRGPLPALGPWVSPCASLGVSFPVSLEACIRHFPWPFPDPQHSVLWLSTSVHVPGMCWTLRILSKTDHVPALVEISLVGKTLGTYCLITVVETVGSCESMKGSLKWFGG